MYRLNQTGAFFVGFYFLFLTCVQAGTETPSAETLWLGVRIERKLGDHEAETRLAVQMKRKFPAASETQRLSQGQYE